jgi:prevent-host-death family protein
MCTRGGTVAEAGIRELRNHLSQYLDRVRTGEELVITDRGTAVARIVPVDRPRTLDRLIEEGLVAAAPDRTRHRPRRRTRAAEPVSDLVGDQRR